MDDHIELASESATSESNGINRRDMLKRTGFVVGAATLWNTPIIRSVALSAAAATTGEGFPFCLDTDGFPTNCDAGGSGPLVVSFQRVDWDEVNQPIWRPFSEPIGGTCDQSFDGSNRYRRDANISLDAITHFEYGKGQLNNVTNLQQRQPIEKLDVECYPIPADSAFVALRFYGAASGGSSILEIAIHTSCSEQLECGDEFAFLRVCGGINANNQNVSC